jgi:uncharacterized integral membrane protein
MQFFIWVAFLVVIGIAIFAIQNSTAPAVLMRFLFWRFETSLIYVILGSIGLGVFVTLFICIPRAVRTAIQMKKLRRALEDSEPRQRGPAPPGQEPK